MEKKECRGVSLGGENKSGALNHQKEKKKRMAFGPNSGNLLATHTGIAFGPVVGRETKMGRAGPCGVCKKVLWGEKTDGGPHRNREEKCSIAAKRHLGKQREHWGR